MSGSFRLVMNQGPQPGQTFVLDQDLLILGRDQSSNIVINDPGASRKHARITRYGGQMVIEDLRSSNGTFINRMRLTGPHTLNNGDVIGLGNAVMLTFHYPPPPTQYQPPPAQYQPPQPQYPPPAPQPVYVPQPPRSRRGTRLVPCAVILALLVCLGSGIAIGGWFYGDQIMVVVQDWLDESDGKIDHIQGGTAVADDGASVTFPPFFGDSKITATFTRATAPSGHVVDDAMVVSGEYLLTLSDPNAVSGDLIVSLPLAGELIPANWDPAGVAPEFYNDQTGDWEPVGQVVGYGEETNQVSFDVPFGAAAQSAFNSHRAPGAMLLVPPYQKVETRYRIRLHFFSNWVTLVSDQSDFEIEYYPISGRSYSLQKDDEWNSASGLATDPKAPDFAEDLDHALNQGYQALLKIRSYTGLLFNPLSTPQGILVTNIGAVEGQTSLFWGTVKISARRINNWSQMQQVATHELVHLLSDQHYNSVSAARNRWFFEATAEYFAARARGLSEGARGQHYANPSINNDVYLSIPIISANVSSYYPAAHFLDWCSRQYGQTVIPEAIVYGSGHPLDRNDVTHFSKSLELHGEPGGIGAAYAAYIRSLISRPEDYGGANSDFKFNITTYTAQHNLSATEFDEYVTYIKLSRLLRPMSTAGVFLWGRNSDDALLVIDSASSSGGSPQAVTYDFYSTLNSAYANATPLDQGLAFPYPNEGIITVPHFGHMEAKKQLEQLIANAGIAGDAQIEVIYYLLRPPPVTEVSDGVVRWSIGKLGNMPRELIQGYHVYKNGIQLTGNPVPVPAEGWDNLSFQSEQIQQGDTLVVQVVDRKGNAWPQVQVIVLPTPTPTPTLTPTPTPGTPTPTPEIPVTPAVGDSFLQVGDTVWLRINGEPMLHSCSGDCQWAPYRSNSGIYGNADDLTVASVQGQSIYLNHQDGVCNTEVWIDYDPTGGLDYDPTGGWDNGTGGIDQLHVKRYCIYVSYSPSAVLGLHNLYHPEFVDGYSDQSYTFSGLRWTAQFDNGESHFGLPPGEAVGHATGSYHHYCISNQDNLWEGSVLPACPCVTESGIGTLSGEAHQGQDRTTCDQLFEWEATSETRATVIIQRLPRD